MLFRSYLSKNKVTRIFVVGCATDFCVDSTIKGGIGHGLDVVIPSDGHTTGDRPHVSAENLVKHFNWNWANLLTGTEKVIVIPTVAAIQLNKKCCQNRNT